MSLKVFSSKIRLCKSVLSNDSIPTLRQFICEVVSQGYPLEFYLEGGRSRNGRTLRAKAGLLSVLIHAYQKGFIQDAIIVPVAFTYDRLIEGSSLEPSDQRGSSLRNWVGRECDAPPRSASPRPDRNCSRPFIEFILPQETSFPSSVVLRKPRNPSDMRSVPFGGPSGLILEL